MVGAQGPHDYITMGGMFTIFKVRDGISSYGDPGWYDDPKGMARPATTEELSRDGIDPDTKSMPPMSHGDGHTNHGSEGHNSMEHGSNDHEGH